MFTKFFADKVFFHHLIGWWDEDRILCPPLSNQSKHTCSKVRRTLYVVQRSPNGTQRVSHQAKEVVQVNVIQNTNELLLFCFSAWADKRCENWVFHMTDGSWPKQLRNYSRKFQEANLFWPLNSVVYLKFPKTTMTVMAGWIIWSPLSAAGPRKLQCVFCRLGTKDQNYWWGETEFQKQELNLFLSLQNTLCGWNLLIPYKPLEIGAQTFSCEFQNSIVLHEFPGKQLEISKISNDDKYLQYNDGSVTHFSTSSFSCGA